MHDFRKYPGADQYAANIIQGIARIRHRLVQVRDRPGNFFDLIVESVRPNSELPIIIELGWLLDPAQMVRMEGIMEARTPEEALDPNGIALGGSLTFASKAAVVTVTYWKYERPDVDFGEMIDQVEHIARGEG